MTRLRAYTVAEADRVLGMTSAEVHKAIEHGLLWAFTIDKATRVPADEVERVRANIARRQRLGVAGQRHAEDRRAEPRTPRSANRSAP